MQPKPLTGTPINLAQFGDVDAQAKALVRLIRNWRDEDRYSTADIARTIEAAPMSVRRRANTLLQQPEEK